MATVRTSVESARGCGYRKGGGIYLVSGGLMAACGRLPVPIDVCPTCHHGIHRSRGWTWIDIDKFTASMPPCPITTEPQHATCAMNGETGRAGLLWVGTQFYPTPQSFRDEAKHMGVSRRISAVPKDFKVGETWVLFAHEKVFNEPCPSEDVRVVGGTVHHDEDCECEGEGVIWKPGIFHAFMPTAIEYVITGDETEEELDRLEKRGFSLVRVIREGEIQFEGDQS